MDLLNEYLALTTDEARAEFLARLTPEQLEALETQATERFAELEAEPASDENVVALTGIADVLEVVAGENERRTAAAADLEASRAAIIDRVRGEAGGEGGEGAEGAGAEGDGDAAAEPELDDDGNPIVTPPAEGEGGEGAGEQQTPEAIAAAAAAAGTTLPRSRPRLGAVSATARPAGPSSTSPTNTAGRAALVAAADVPGIAAGSTLVAGGSTDLEQLGEAIVARWNSLAGSRRQQKVLVASARASYPEERQLDATNPLLNVERVRAVLDAARVGGQALVAAGGYCAPATIRYDLPTVGDTDRPVRDSLPSFQAPRGRARWIPSPVLSDVPVDAITDWTNDDDIAAAGNPHVDPDDDVTKPCARIDCPAEDDLILEAIVRCLEFGNFNARTFPELIQAYQRLVGVAWARHAETKLLDQIDAASTAVTSAARGGAVADLLGDVDRLVTNLRGVYRVQDTRVRVILPVLFREMARTDLALQMPGGGTFDERYALAATRIDAWFAARNANVTWTLDSQVEALIGAGAIPALPATVVARVFIEGTFGFVDGGQLDLGIIRDSGLVAINSFREFSESWELAAKFGSERAFKLTSTVCATGTTSGTTAIACP